MNTIGPVRRVVCRKRRLEHKIRACTKFGDSFRLTVPRVDLKHRDRPSRECQERSAACRGYRRVRYGAPVSAVIPLFHTVPDRMTVGPWGRFVELKVRRMPRIPSRSSHISARASSAACGAGTGSWWGQTAPLSWQTDRQTVLIWDTTPHPPDSYFKPAPPLRLPRHNDWRRRRQVSDIQVNLKFSVPYRGSAHGRPETQSPRKRLPASSSRLSSYGHVS